MADIIGTIQWHWHCFSSVMELHYAVDRILSDGDQTKVYLCRSIETQEPIVVKTATGPNNQVANEANVLGDLIIPGVLPLTQYLQDGNLCTLVMPYAPGGDLFHFIAYYQTIPEPLVKRTMFTLLNALHSLHANGIVHRDIKPENILILDEKYDGYNVCLSDFGLAKKIVHGELINQACGTLDYAAPEIVTSTPYNEKVDIWSLGVVAFVMLTGSHPCCSSDPAEIVADIVAGFPDIGDIDLTVFSANALDLLCNMLQVNPINRCSTEQALQHPWFQDIE